MEIIKLGILYFSLFTWYQSQERKPNFWEIVFYSDLLLRRSSRSSRRPPPSLSPATFREALLRPKTTNFEAHEADLPAGGNPAGNWKHTRRHARPFSGSSPSTRQRVSARVGACLLLRRRDSTHRVVRRRLGLLSLRRSNPSPPYPPFGHFCAAVTFHSSSVFNSRDPDLVQPPTATTATSSVFSLPNCVVATSKIICSILLAVICLLIRALFDPNLVQSPVKWIWQLKILFLLLLSLDLLLSHQKN